MVKNELFEKKVEYIERSDYWYFGIKSRHGFFWNVVLMIVAFPVAAILAWSYMFSELINIERKETWRKLK